MYTRKLKKRKSSRTKRSHARRTKRSSRTKRTKRSHARHTKRSSHKQMRGGFAVPLFGAPYNAASLNPQGNYYPYNPYVEQWPSQSNAMLGGGKKRNGMRMRSGQKGMRSGQKGMRSGQKGMRMKGGGITEFVTSLFPQEILNISRSVPAGLGHMYDKFNGTASSASSMVYPTQQPNVISNAMRSDMIKPSNINKFYENSNNLVSKI
jgi:hypothetical protein